MSNTTTATTLRLNDASAVAGVIIASIFLLVGLCQCLTLIPMRNWMPLRAHNIFVLFAKIFLNIYAAVFLYTYFLNSLTGFTVSGSLAVLVPLLYAGPTTLRLWIILHLVLYNRSKVQQFEQEATSGAKSHWHNYLRFALSKGLLVVVLVAVLVWSVATVTCAVLTYQLQDADTGERVAAVLFSITGAIQGALQAILVIGLFAFKIKVKFGIIPALLAHLLSQVLVVIVVAVYGLLAFIGVGDRKLLANVLDSLAIAAVMMICLETIFVIGITQVQSCIWKRSARNASTTSASELDTLLTDKNGFTRFKQYCIKELSVENVLFIEQMRLFEVKSAKAATYTEVADSVQSIVEKFVSPKGELALNITAKQTNPLNTAVQQQDVSNVITALRDIKKAIMIVMNDTFSRFKQTREYTNWVAEIESMKQLKMDE